MLTREGNRVWDRMWMALILKIWKQISIIFKNEWLM